MSKTPSNPLYEKHPEDWARRFIAHKLGVRIIGRKKDEQWHDIVAHLVCKLDHCDNLLNTVRHM